MENRISCRLEVEVAVEVEVVLPPSFSRGDGVTFTTNLPAEAANNYNSLDNSPPIATITADAADVTVTAATASDAPAPTARYQSITRMTSPRTVVPACSCCYSHILFCTTRLGAIMITEWSMLNYLSES